MKAETLLESARAHRQSSSWHMWSDDKVAAFASKREALARDEERERCCRDVCAYCRKGDAPERVQYKSEAGYWVHTYVDMDDRTAECGASTLREAIRARKVIE